MTDPRRKRCFVIMPYGEKADAGGERTNFDIVYEFIIKLALEEAKSELGVDIECVRSDKIEESGSIHTEMFDHIATAEIAIVDITTLNPNVFYELGIRHALRKGVTVLLKKVGAALPFNIQGVRVIEYDYAAVASYAQTRRQIRHFIANGIARDLPDSPVLTALPNVRVDFRSEVLPRSERYDYRTGDGRTLGVITGDIIHVKGVDVWVNAENTHMQMARFHDWGISSVIRYAGAKKNEVGAVEEDTVAVELASKMKGSTSVPAGSVIVTSAGSLLASHGVKAIYHAAAVEGIVGGGYVPVRNLSMCVTNALARAASDHHSSVVMPLMGVGVGGDLRMSVRDLMTAALAHFAQDPNTSVKSVHFMAWSQRELAACLDRLDNAAELRRS